MVLERKIGDRNILDKFAEWAEFVKKYPREAKLMQNLFIEDQLNWMKNVYNEISVIPGGKEVLIELKKRAQRF
jgi:hypothetical protein